jgi:hypothetical protein
MATARTMSNDRSKSTVGCHILLSSELSSIGNNF